MNVLHFFLNGQPHAIDFSQPDAPSPLCSVLHYLRATLQLTGTKELCGKGDCGACTIIVVSPTEGLRALDACLLRLPQLQGKHVLTIEAPAQYLNVEPIKEALRKTQSGRCGFCSPAMVLSLYAHIKNKLPHTREAFQQSLSGNLCRCTGYETILEAAAQLKDALAELEAGEWPLAFPEPVPPSESILFTKGRLSYFMPRSVSELLLIRQAFAQSKILAGLTGGALEYVQNPKTATDLVDISEICEYKTITRDEEGITVGAGCTIEQLRRYMLPLYPAFSTHLEAFAGAQVRNQATLGGSLVGGSPVGDLIVVCMALKAVCLIEGPLGTRQVASKRFTIANGRVDLREGEVLAAVRFPLPDPQSHLFVFKQATRKNMAVSTVSCACNLTVLDKKCIAIQLVYGGMADVPVHAKQAEKYLRAEPFTLFRCKKAALLLAEDFAPQDDVRGTAAYRLTVAQNTMIALYESFKAGAAPM